jgi:hypothetical protein
LYPPNMNIPYPKHKKKEKTINPFL